MSPKMQARLAQLPPSAQAVAQHLATGEPMTGKELREATGLPRRTIYSALCRLRELGWLKERASLQDTRQRYLWLEMDETPSPTMAPPAQQRSQPPFSASTRRHLAGAGAS